MVESRASWPRAILIAGPTASGKSALAVTLAERLGGTVVNADSMQVYRDLAILTARPPHAEHARAPHRLYGHVDATEAYSVGRWLDDAAGVLAERQMPVFVGGTGLYFDALTTGIAPVPAIPAETRQRVRARAVDGAPALHAELARRDPETAAILRPGDTQRVLRALEVLEATGRPLSSWQREPASSPLLDPGRVLRIMLTPERAWLRARIAARFEAMTAMGALDEVSALLARALDPALPVMKALGVASLAAHLRGEIGRDEAIARAILETGRYAKRQDTWFRNRMADWPKSTPDTALDTVLAALARGG